MNKRERDGDEGGGEEDKSRDGAIETLGFFQASQSLSVVERA